MYQTALLENEISLNKTLTTYALQTFEIQKVFTATELHHNGDPCTQKLIVSDAAYIYKHIILSYITRDIDKIAKMF